MFLVYVDISHANVHSTCMKNNTTTSEDLQVVLDATKRAAGKPGTFKADTFRLVETTDYARSFVGPVVQEWDPSENPVASSEE